jgi:hypothetical protein
LQRQQQELQPLRHDPASYLGPMPLGTPGPVAGVPPPMAPPVAAGAPPLVSRGAPGPPPPFAPMPVYGPPSCGNRNNGCMPMPMQQQLQRCSSPQAMLEPVARNASGLPPQQHQQRPQQPRVI